MFDAICKRNHFNSLENALELKYLNNLKLLRTEEVPKMMSARSFPLETEWNVFLSYQQCSIIALPFQSLLLLNFVHIGFVKDVIWISLSY